MADAVATQPHNLPLHISREKCAGKTYIVTGANVGLGLEASKHLVAVGAAKVIMAVRNLSAGEAAKASIEAGTGTSGVAEVWALDLSSYDSVKVFAKRAVAELERIDALIENAGVAAFDRTMAEGHLLNITVNVLSTLLLAVLLLPKMSDDAKKFGIVPHIVLVSSGVGFDAKADWDVIKSDPLVEVENEGHKGLKMYPLSKLVETIATRQLAALAPVSRTGVVMNIVCPGSCKTELGRHAPPAFRKMLQESKEKYGRTAEDGSRTLLYGAVAGKESHGCFLDSCRIADDIVPIWVTDEEGQKSQKLLWDAVAGELESVQPGCVKAIL
ncbi:hypothetical protein VE01_07240 [Pseudogymnoascus verrucosus]|uniref:Uncharacterized protein n=1 Tax=Pseudogymnoascus verrucosus TaxID=342668 RepID=A0A1B8GF56_9PEZI|nr:uncharacterized protein VE01_07240 [Pseudogymnoascus verrucosus]OBT94465.1 hypothetical protein VE01_07240 [Pseudogymnoascus verrucosus]